MMALLSLLLVSLSIVLSGSDLRHLGDDSFQVREQASHSLIWRDLLSLPALWQASATADDPEVKHRAGLAAEVIEDRWRGLMDYSTAVWFMVRGTEDTSVIDDDLKDCSLGVHFAVAYLAWKQGFITEGSYKDIMTPPYPEANWYWASLVQRLQFKFSGKDYPPEYDG